jgi:hypothetical protein
VHGRNQVVHMQVAILYIDIEVIEQGCMDVQTIHRRTSKRCVASMYLCASSMSYASCSPFRSRGVRTASPCTCACALQVVALSLRTGVHVIGGKIGDIGGDFSGRNAPGGDFGGREVNNELFGGEFGAGSRVGLIRFGASDEFGAKIDGEVAMRACMYIYVCMYVFMYVYMFV